MLRTLVLLFLLVNAGIYGWLQSNPQAFQGDREPQRLERQVAPDMIQVLPDLPASASAASAAASASAASDDTATDTGTACAETPGLANAEFAALKVALAQAGVPVDMIRERRESQGGSWAAYLGKFPDIPARVAKAQELTRLGVTFDRVNAPAALAPGLSLGRFPSRAEATQRLADLTAQGVHGARVVTITPPVIQHHLQVRGDYPSWQRAAGGQQFERCAADAPPSTT